MMAISDRMVFFKYAVPCAEVYVRRGKINQQYMDMMLKKISNGEELPEKTEYLFETAPALCETLAKMMKREKIDRDVIRQYFLIEHNSIVERRAKAGEDVDPEKCKTSIGIVSKVNSGKVYVDTGSGKTICRSDFFGNIKSGDNVIMHFGFIVDMLTKDEVSKYFGSSAKKYLPM